MTPEERERLRKKVFSGDKVDRDALRKLAAEFKKETEDEEFSMAIELWITGWTSYPVGERPLKSWYWRRPPKPGRKKGKLFSCTDRAFYAMRKESGKSTEL